MLYLGVYVPTYGHFYLFFRAFVDLGSPNFLFLMRFDADFG